MKRKAKYTKALAVFLSIGLFFTMPETAFAKGKEYTTEVGDTAENVQENETASEPEESEAVSGAEESETVPEPEESESVSESEESEAVSEPEESESVSESEESETVPEPEESESASASEESEAGTEFKEDEMVPETQEQEEISESGVQETDSADGLIKEVQELIDRLPPADKLNVEEMTEKELDLLRQEMKTIEEKLESLDEEHKAVLHIENYLALQEILAALSLEEKESTMFNQKNTAKIGTQEELVQAFAEIKAAEKGSEFTLHLTADIVLDVNQDGALDVTAGHTVTLLGHGHTLVYKAKGINVAGGILNLGADGQGNGTNGLMITAAGNGQRSGALLHIRGNGTVNMYSGVTLTGNINTSSLAGGVEMQSGTFHMYGGTISECESLFGMGGGVALHAYEGVCTFHMYDGAITGNKATSLLNSRVYGGGVYVDWGNFTDSAFYMYGGSISGNEAVSTAGAAYGGGVYAGGVFHMEGGTISGNICKGNNNNGYGGGICNYNDETVISGSTIADNTATSGAGIYNWKNIRLANVSITGNQADYYGGAVFNQKSSVTMQGGRIGENNAAYGGGGIYDNKGTLAARESSIENNTAKNGAGIYANGSTDIRLSACGIVKNSASGLGGGTAIAEGATFSVTESIIANNLADTEGSDIWADAGASLNLCEIPEKMVVYEADQKNQYIDGWYKDLADSRYTPQEGGKKEDISVLTVPIALVASYALPHVFQVTYEYRGHVPEGAPVPPAGEQYEEGAEVVVAPVPILDGWNFEGWIVTSPQGLEIENGTLIMPGEDIILAGEWKKQATPIEPTAAAYQVEHYRQQEDGSYRLEETEFPLYGKIGETVYAKEKSYEGYSVNNSKSVMSGVVTEPTQQENGEVTYLILKVYYDRQQTTIPQEPEHRTGSLTVSKKVSGEGGDTNYEFTFTVTLGDTAVNGAYGEMYFEKGTAVFTLKHGESLTAAGLPAGISYTVRESDNEGYTVTKSGDTGVIDPDGTANASFENHKDRKAENQTESEKDAGANKGGNGKGGNDSTGGKNQASQISATGVKTEDDSNITLWILLLGVSGVVLLGLAAYFRSGRKGIMQKDKK